MYFSSDVTQSSKSIVSIDFNFSFSRFFHKESSLIYANVLSQSKNISGGLLIYAIPKYIQAVFRKNKNKKTSTFS